MLLLKTTVAGGVYIGEDDQLNGIVGAIVDDGSRIGKEERVAKAMAVDDFNDYTNKSLVFHVRNSQKEPLRAAVAAMDLIEKHGAQAILGLQTWEELSLVAEIGSRNHIPVLSLADDSNMGNREVAFSTCNFTQPVTVIYEDIDSSVTGVLRLSDALREKGIEVHHVGLPPIGSLSLSKELERLKGERCRVFIVHLSSSFAVHLFETATRMKMMEKGFVWITTTAFTNLIHSVNVSTIATTMQGIIGVKTYFFYSDIPILKIFV
ncbi:hypothetical protein PTKIN_Ptkin11bG0135600 [Pterospermum kingtungense]